MDVNLSVVDGGKHWTAKEIEERQESEVKMPKVKRLSAPRWLGKDGQKLFRKYAKQLLDFPEGVVSTLDTSTLARYCDCELAYVEASEQRSSWMRICADWLTQHAEGDELAGADPDKVYEGAKEQVDFWTSQMVKLEKIARSCATEMGMTISSRCRLVVPNVKKEPSADPLAALQKKFKTG
jgi:P27 family predicted phage terminase small subunit